MTGTLLDSGHHFIGQAARGEGGVCALPPARGATRRCALDDRREVCRAPSSRYIQRDACR